MSDTKALLLDALYEQENARPRSLQKELGPSQLGSCKRQTVFKILQVESVNETEKLAAIFGTAIHDTIEKALARKGHDTVEITVPGIAGLLGPGHIDFYQPGAKKVTDWKTTKKKSLRYFPRITQRWQVMVYGYLVRAAGYEVEEVELVAIPRDGEADDILVHTEKYDEQIALDAIAWLEDRKREADSGELPAPEKPASFCAKYCEFYGPELCVGK